MRGVFVIIALAAVVGVWQAISLSRALRTGRTHSRYGTVTRQGQPDRFRRYVISAWIVLGLSAGAIAWALVAPQTFR